MSKIKLILSLLSSREKKQLFFVVFALLIMGLVEIIGVGSLSPFMAVISNREIIHTNVYLNTVYVYFNFASDSDFIIAFGIAIILVMALGNGCLAGVSFLIRYYTGKRFYSISTRLFEKYLRQPYIFYLNANTADLSKTLLGDTLSYISGVLLQFLQLVSNSIISVFIILLLIAVNPLLSALISALFILSYVSVFSLVRNFLSRKGKERNHQSLLRYKCINEIWGGIKDIKMLGKERVFINFFSAPTKEFGISEAISDFVGEVPKYLLETLAFACMLGIIIFMVKEGNKVENFLPTLTLYGFAAYRLLPVLQKVFKSVASIKYYFPVLRTISGYFNELPEGESFPAEDLPRMEFSRNISLKNIRFKYPSTHKDIINGQSIDITANTSIAFVGPTGCGKTTLVDILLGLLLPQSGEIYVDDKKIDDANRRSWQKNIGYVPQAIYLADDTIRNNIAFGISPEKIDDEAIIKAAHLANLHDFIVGELEKGYDTIVGERGIRLSGGQRQRIGIARAVYHDPSVLVLDEATSALDGLTENAIMDAIRNMSHRKTIIMIAHRLTTVKSCDRIYIMEKGTILDSGIYDDLYTRNVAFRKMADGSVK